MFVVDSSEDMKGDVVSEMLSELRLVPTVVRCGIMLKKEYGGKLRV